MTTWTGRGEAQAASEGGEQAQIVDLGVGDPVIVTGEQFWLVGVVRSQISERRCVGVFLFDLI